MNLLFFGGKRFLGNKIVSNLINSKKERIKKIESISKKDFTFLNLDVKNTKKIEKILKKKK